MNKYIILILSSLIISCAKPDNGQNGSDGIDGAVGLTGPSGEPGPQGSPGPVGTAIKVVQLCKGITHYPDTFCEVAFCINGGFYATYSTNGGFSVNIPNGDYSSNGINCSCSFTVLDNCEVRN